MSYTDSYLRHALFFTVHTCFLSFYLLIISVHAHVCAHVHTSMKVRGHLAEASSLLWSWRGGYLLDNTSPQEWRKDETTVIGRDGRT